MLACALIISYRITKWRTLSVQGFLPYCMLIIAGWIAVTRVQDYKHRQSDVFCGATIGMTVTLLLWNLTKQFLDEKELDDNVTSNNDNSRQSGNTIKNDENV
jgi:membrane-associated phospholipid phosphatase